MKKILLLEDDTLLGQTLTEMLQDEGYDPYWVQNGEAAAEAAYDMKFDLYVFDVNVPLLSGFELLEALRDARDTTPTLFISALVDLESISQGFRAGAFDYIKKPFFPEELLIRVNARIGQRPTLLAFGEITYDPASGEIRRDGNLLSFGEVQLQLLDLFMRRIGSVIDRSELLECLEHPSDTALRVALNKLRNNTGWQIKNIRGVGYLLEEH